MAERGKSSQLAVRIARGLDTLGLAFPEDAPEKLASLSELVHDWGQRINLSGHRSPVKIADRLVLDAAGIGSVLPHFASLADLGAGAGFPGLPLAILFPSAQVTLVESRQRRHYFQRAAIRELGLGNVNAVRGRIESAEPVPSDIALAQAVGPAAEVFAAIRPWAKAGGWLGIPATVGSQAPALDAVLTEKSYRVPGSDAAEADIPRLLWMIRAA
ncbi:MAG: 16S rRNA (guanine(527)-N(7))-methyltransferase RsmG [Myxococcota bacterium]|nr:16S rRNA (guanine(527)-N(7))-methyltransferase RsmG [Myxococcota bacterium]